MTSYASYIKNDFRTRKVARSLSNVLVTSAVHLLCLLLEQCHSSVA